MNVLRMLQPARRVSPDMIAKFSKIPVANVSDVMMRLTAGGSRLRPMHAGGVLAGPAFTVKTRPGDNLIIHKAIDMAQPGDVVVIDAGGDLTNSLMGEMMLSWAEKRGIAGVILNGAIRDLAYIREHSFPVFAAGVTHRGPYKSGPGETNVPVAIDGMVIEPGDLVMGDDDGIMCVPYDVLNEVYDAAAKKSAGEVKQLDAILSGAYGSSERKWVDKALSESGFEFVYERAKS